MLTWVRRRRERSHRRRWWTLHWRRGRRRWPVSTYNMTSLRRLRPPQNCWRQSYLCPRHRYSCSCRISAQPKVIVETFYHYSHSQVKFEIWASESSFWVGQNTQLFVSGPKFTKFDSPTREGSLWIKYSSNFWYLDPFRRYRDRAKFSEIAPNYACFCPTNFFSG